MNGYNSQEELDRLMDGCGDDVIRDEYLDLQDLVCKMVKPNDFYDVELLKWSHYFVEVNWDAIWNAKRNKFMMDAYLKWVKENYVLHLD